MKKEDREKIEEIIEGMNCPKDFKCAENGFEHLGQISIYRDQYNQYRNYETYWMRGIFIGNTVYAVLPNSVYAAKWGNITDTVNDIHLDDE